MRSQLAILATAALLAVAAFAVIGWPASLFVDHDFVQYWLAGRALLAGQDPYDPALWRALHEQVRSNGSEIAPGAGFLYPVLTAVAVVPFSVLPFSLAAGAWFVALIASAVAGIVALGTRLYVARPRWDLAVLLSFAAVIRPDFVLPIDGNITGFLVGIVGGSIALLLDRRPFAAGALLGLGVVKPHLLLVFVPALFLFVASRDRPRLVGGAAATVGALLATSLALAPRWIGEWSAEAERIGTYARTNVWGVAPPEIAWPIAAGLVAVLIAWWRLAHPSLPVASGSALSVSLLLAPYAFMIDQAVLLVGVAAFVGLVQHLAPVPRNALLLALVAVASPWYMPLLVGVLPINILRLVPAITVLTLIVVVQAAHALRLSGPARVAAEASSTS